MVSSTTPNTQAKKKIDELKIIKIKNFDASEDIIKEMKRQFT